MADYGIGAGIGGFMEGLAHGMRAKQEHDLKLQQLDLQKQHISAQQKYLEAQAAERDFNTQQKLKQGLAQETYAKMLEQGSPSLTDPGHLEMAQPGQTESNLPGEMSPNLARPTLRDQIIGAMPSTPGRPGDPMRAAQYRTNPNAFSQADANRIDPMEAVRTLQALNNGGAAGTPQQGPQTAPGAMPDAGRPIDANTAAAIFREAGNDAQRARELARSRGYQVSGSGGGAPAPTQAPNPSANQWVPSLRNGKISFTQPGVAAAARVAATNEARQSTPMAPGAESQMARIDPQGEIQLAPMGLTPTQAMQQGFRKVEAKVLDSARALAPAKQAMADLEGPLKKLARENTSIVGRMSNIAGSRGELLGMNLGGIAQDFGASSAGDDVKGGWLNFMQHYESVVGGLRGASSPELQKVMEQRGPQAGMTDHQIAQRVTYLRNIVRAMEGEVKSSISGGKYSGKLDAAALTNPNNLKPDEDFLRSLKSKK